MSKVIEKISTPEEADTFVRQHLSASQRMGMTRLVVLSSLYARVRPLQATYPAQTALIQTSVRRALFGNTTPAYVPKHLKEG